MLAGLGAFGSKLVATRRFALIVVALLAAACVAGVAHAADPRILVFTKTAGYRHDSIPAAIQASATSARRTAST